MRYRPLPNGAGAYKVLDRQTGQCVLQSAYHWVCETEAARLNGVSRHWTAGPLQFDACDLEAAQ
jgi:hypothetical protein